MTSGLLSFATANTPADAEDGWVSVGAAESCEFHYDEDPLTSAPLGFDLHGHCITVSMKVDSFSPLGYWLLFRRRHPRITAMRSAYRRKHR